MRRLGPAVAALAVALAGCSRQPAVQPNPHYVVGDPFQAGGEWFYPRTFAAYDQTGLSTVADNEPGTLTANGEAYSPHALAAASQVLPLPSIVQITDLVTGRTLDVRVNDRGPADPRRLIAVTPRVAQLLGFPSTGVVEVEVKLVGGRSADIQQRLGAGPQVKAAPVATITATSLGAPGSGGTGATQTLGPAASGLAPADTGALSGRIGQTEPDPGPLWVQMGSFGRPADAVRAEARLSDLSPQIVPLPGDDRVLYALRIGPYTSVAAADRAMGQVLSRGITDPAIIVR